MIFEAHLMQEAPILISLLRNLVVTAQPIGQA